MASSPEPTEAQSPSDLLESSVVALFRVVRAWEVSLFTYESENMSNVANIYYLTSFALLCIRSVLLSI